MARTKKNKIELSSDLLVDLGYEKLTAQQASELLADLYKTLEAVVGSELGSQMNSEQLDEFGKYYDAEDDTGALLWLEQNFKDYRGDVQKAFDKLKGELREISSVSDVKKHPDSGKGS